MRRLALLAAAFALVVLVAGMVVQTPTAQTTSPGVNGACRSGEAAVPAADLPETVDLDDCPIGGSVITDNGVRTVLPAPGEGIYVEAMTTEGSQELQVTRYRDGTVELEHVGDESAEAQAEPEIAPAASSPGECSDRARTRAPWRVEFNLKWYFNSKTTPDELSSSGALSAIRRGTENITDTQSNCRRGDRVPHFMDYQGPIRDHLACSGNDGVSVVSFGMLPQGTLAQMCIRYLAEGGNVKKSDILINKARYNWTTNPGARSCKSRYDLESVVTHERGHTFGLDHVSEDSHGKLTMSTRINGPCQSSERTLGLGDWRGLDRMYPKGYDPDNPR